MATNRVLAHRLIDRRCSIPSRFIRPTAKSGANSAPRDTVFEVLLPDVDERAVRRAHGRRPRALQNAGRPSVRRLPVKLHASIFAASEGGEEMSASDGYVVGVTKVVDHGPESSRWDLVIVGDGYQRQRADELPHTCPELHQRAAHDAAVQRAVLRHQRASHRRRLEPQRRRRSRMRRRRRGHREHLFRCDVLFDVCRQPARPAVDGRRRRSHCRSQTPMCR